MSEFGKLELSNKGTNNGRGYDIYYEFYKGFNFVEIESKRKFCFIQPWVQFPNKEYSDECEAVSIELVKRFNNYEKLQEENKILREALEFSALVKNWKFTTDSGLDRSEFNGNDDEFIMGEGHVYGKRAREALAKVRDR